MSTTVSPSFKPSSETAWFRHPDMLKPNQAKTSNNFTPDQTWTLAGYMRQSLLV
jgi:hypothetical protein